MAEYGTKQIFHTPLTDTSKTDKEGVGVYRIESGNIYQYVQDSGAGVAAYELCYMPVGTADIVKATANTDNAHALGALAVPQAAIETSYYGWAMIKGVATILKMQSTKNFTVGRRVRVGATAGRLQYASTTDVYTDAIYVLVAASTTEANCSCRIAFM